MGMRWTWPALRVAWAGAPEGVSGRPWIGRSPFVDALGDGGERSGATGPRGAAVEGLGVLWTAPPCVPTLVLVDPALDARLSPQARAWLAGECVASPPPPRLSLKHPYAADEKRRLIRGGRHPHIHKTLYLIVRL